MQLDPALGIFGGTFDPIHYGHILPVIEAAQQTQIEKVALLPCFIPSHKNAAQAKSQDRLAMVARVCEQYPLFYVDPRDIQRGTVTYTVDSMVALRQTFPRSPLCFFIGTDSLRSLSSWHQWSTLFSYCHFIVCQRADQSTLSLEQHGPVQAQQQQKLLLERQTHNILDLHTSLAGRIYLADTPTVNISSTVIKQRLAAHQSVQDMLPSTVLDYIEQYKLYPPYMDF